MQAKGNSGSGITSCSKAVISHCQKISFQQLLLLLCVRKTLAWGNHDGFVLSCWKEFSLVLAKELKISISGNELDKIINLSGNRRNPSPIDFGTSINGGLLFQVVLNNNHLNYSLC